MQPDRNFINSSRADWKEALESSDEGQGGGAGKAHLVFNSSPQLVQSSLWVP